MMSSDFMYQRRRMVETLVRTYGIKDERVLEAMRNVPRHLFVGEHLRNQAYGDHALPSEAAQTISQPFVVARMTELLEVSKQHTVLEIGTGTGYQTAILARLAGRVFSLERIGSLARQAISRIRELGLQNVKIQIFDGTVGWSDAGPFDRVLVTAGAPSVPEPLLEQLAVGGILVVPEGDLERQKLVRYQKLRGGGQRRQEGEPVRFVPLVGRFGWQGESI
ncbi:MAG: protein-L-isoaspartate(D-aspartate) O-methyltransferase [Acidobacteria bacterium]|nr:protein-L-isoaspartate(D-aspartate) O-methyltransferase [Acidobacteriota bacterium]